MERFDGLKNIDQNYYCSNYHNVSANKRGVKCGTSLRFWENKGCNNPIDPYGWLQWYFSYWLGRRSVDDERLIKRWKETVSRFSRFKDNLIKMIKDVNGKLNDYSIPPKIRQILLQWGYELTESEL